MRNWKKNLLKYEKFINKKYYSMIDIESDYKVVSFLYKCYRNLDSMKYQISLDYENNNIAKDYCLELANRIQLQVITYQKDVYSTSHESYQITFDGLIMGFNFYFDDIIKAIKRVKKYTLQLITQNIDPTKIILTNLDFFYFVLEEIDYSSDNIAEEDKCLLHYYSFLKELAKSIKIKDYSMLYNDQFENIDNQLQPKVAIQSLDDYFIFENNMLNPKFDRQQFIFILEYIFNNKLNPFMKKVDLYRQISKYFDVSENSLSTYNSMINKTECKKLINEKIIADLILKRIQDSKGKHFS